MTEGLFEEPAREQLNVGDRVILRTVWDGQEKGHVEAMGHDADGWPMVTVTTSRGHRVCVSRTSVTLDG